ncbi:wall-associated receptor kinase-like 1 [Cornus florida]|uniref:wall-associated receptor kinase-like 1 n=1 Tax=Cornus florida TaxID=4283 RepID=UPI002899EC98|nr:wall-associated receptor kinase-like 1 [Cornus florida]
MVIQLVLQIELLLWLTQASSALAATLAMAKPGCQDRCGNVIIPFPFGIGANCSGHWSFEISCNKSFNTFKPFITSIRLEVLEISLTEGTVRVNNPLITSNCNNRVNNQAVDLIGTPFSFSDTNNRFTAIGCDNLALIDWGGMVIGCVSNCNFTSRDKSCYGINCCQTTIPPSLKYINASFRSIDSNNDKNECKYAFMVEQDWFTNLTDPYAVQKMEVVPAVLTWRTYGSCQSFSLGSITYGALIPTNPQNGKVIPPENGKKGCKNYIKCRVGAVVSNSSSLCGTNASCSSYSNQSSSYLCQCDRGYEGNPYLRDGCQDIDECARGTNRCHMNCSNTPGSYKCYCPPGYISVGFKGSYCYKLKDIEGKLGNRRNGIIIIGTSTGLGILFLLIGTWWMITLVKRRRKIKVKEKFFKRNGGLLLKQQLSSGEGNVEKTKLFTSKELEKATDQFNENRILGQGGQGTVYKGMLTDGRIVAVKKSKIVDEGQLEQFINEVVILSQIIHRNVVKLHGCCLETEVPLLVYEFIPNGTLFQYIHDQNEEFPLSWDMRVRIAVEVAGALSYLHSAATIPIYHRDIKSTNILLDDKYRAKVSDFGTSRSIAVDQTHLTTKVLGTFGYLDPQYFQSSQFTEKSDVYSFGVVLVELITGQKPISSTISEKCRSLATYFISTMEENRLFDILDARVVKDDGKEEIMQVANLAKRCLNLDGKNRPTMKEVAMELEMITMSHGASTIQQNYEEVEFPVAELTGPWDAASTSTGFYLDSCVSSSSDVQYLLSK